MCIIIYTIPECSSTFRNGNGFFFVAPEPAPSEPGGPSPKSQTKKSVQTQNNHSIFLAIFLPSKRMPRSNKPIYTKKSNKSQKFCKPKNKISKFENPTNKTPKKKKKKKAKLKFCSQKHVKKKKKKPKPNRLWVYNGWGVVHRGCGDFRGAWCLIVAGLVQGFSWSLEGGLALLARGLIAWVETWEWEWKLELSLSRLSAMAMVRLWVRVWEWWAEEKDERRLKRVWGEVGL